MAFSVKVAKLKKQGRIPSRAYVKMRPVWLWSTATPIFQQITNLSFDPMTLTLNQFEAFINVNPHTKFGFNPTNSTWIITRNARWLLTGKISLTRNRMTLTLKRHIDNSILNMYTKFEFNLTNGSYSTARTKFLPNHENDLDLRPYDLDLLTNFNPQQCLPSHQVWFQSDR